MQYSEPTKFDSETGSTETALADARFVDYCQLKQVARRLTVHEPRNSTLTATALVHELYLKLADRTENGGVLSIRSLQFAAHVMRQILIDRARSRLARRRAEDRHGVQQAAQTRVAESEESTRATELLELEDALNRFAERFPDHAELVRLRVFGGVSIEDAAESIGMPRATAYRKWEFAKAWLARTMEHCLP